MNEQNDFLGIFFFFFADSINIDDDDDDMAIDSHSKIWVVSYCIIY